MSDWSQLNAFAKKIYSQTGEEGILDRIFELIGTTHQVAVEFGASDGYSLSNTRFLHERGWTCHMWDGHVDSVHVKKHLITAENINELFAQYQIPDDLDLLSIDIDGNDYWVWRALDARPRVVVVEFNGALPREEAYTVPYDPAFRYDGTNYYGASFAALCNLGRQKGYVPVCQRNNLNLFFVRADLVPADQVPTLSFTPAPCHPPDPQNRPWFDLRTDRA